MKRNKLYAGVILALAAGGAQAYAPGFSHNTVIRMGGASAQDGNLESVIYNDICVADANRNRWSYNNSNSDFRAISCTTKAFGTIPAGLTLLVLKRSSGGSYFGAGPLQTPVETIDFINPNGTCSAASSVAGYTHNCTQLSSQTINAGISDVNPEMFVGVNVPTGQREFSRPQDVTVYKGTGLVFGAAVSLTLRDTLQNLLVAGGKLPAQCNTTDRESVSCMPSIPRQMLSSALGGTLLDASQIAINGTDLVTAAGAAAPANTAFQICRRENGSGTGAVANFFALNNPCATSKIPLTTNNDNTEVQENSTSGAQDSCLATAGRWTIGYNSTERNVSRSLGYRFVKVDGVEPTIRNVWAGKTSMWGEITVQHRADEANTNIVNIVSQLAGDISTPARTAARNTGFNHSFGQGGYVTIVDPAKGYAPNSAWSAANPVVGINHIQGNLDNCRFPLLDLTDTTNSKIVIE